MQMDETSAMDDPEQLANAGAGRRMQARSAFLRRRRLAFARL